MLTNQQIYHYLAKSCSPLESNPLLSIIKKSENILKDEFSKSAANMDNKVNEFSE